MFTELLKAESMQILKIKMNVWYVLENKDEITVNIEQEIPLSGKSL